MYHLTYGVLIKNIKCVKIKNKHQLEMKKKKLC